MLLTVETNNYVNRNKETFEMDTNSPDECLERRRIFYVNLNVFRDDKSELNRYNMVTARSEYKTVLRRARLSYNIDQTTQLNNARLNNAKEYWNILRGTTNAEQQNIPLSDFMFYFKAVNNPDSRFFIPDEDIINFNDKYIKGKIQIMFSELDVPISVDEITVAISQLKCGKAVDLTKY